MSSRRGSSLALALTPIALSAVAFAPSGCTPPREQPAQSSRPAPSASPAVSVPTEPGIYYTFRVPTSLDELAARVCFRGAPPARLDPPMGAAAPFLKHVEHDGAPLAAPAGVISLGGIADGDCIDYVVDTRAILERGRDGARRAGDDVLLSPDWWLYKPEPRDERPIRARFEGALHAVVPWPEESLHGFTHRIPESCFLWKAQGAFGSFEPRVLTPPRGRIETYFLGDGFGDETPTVVRWLERSAESASILFGRFPAPAAQVLVVPQARRSTFGYVVRGGGATVTLLLPERPERDDLDWMATHELLHLALPPMPSEDAWLFEGLITYLAAVARVRSGMISEREGWWELLDGFRRGPTKSTGRTTREESRHMHETHAYWRVYWAGAAMAFEWDVRLHRQGSAIEAVLSRLLEEDLAHHRRWQASDVIARLDALCGCDVFRTVTSAHLDEVAFPDTSELTSRLGVRLDGDSVAFDEDAPEAAIRRAIMRPPP